MRGVEMITELKWSVDQNDAGVNGGADDTLSTCATILVCHNVPLDDIPRRACGIMAWYAEGPCVRGVLN